MIGVPKREREREKQLRDDKQRNRGKIKYTIEGKGKIQTKGNRS